MEAIRNIAFYKFVQIDDPKKLREMLFQRCHALHLKGTILLAQEGINAMVAGPDGAVQYFEEEIKKDPRFGDLLIKVSFSAKIPFKRLRVKVKPEVLTLGRPEIKPGGEKAQYIKPQELYHGLKNQDDMTLIDIRNDFEVGLGTFQGALNPKTKSFSEFVQFAKKLNLNKEKKIVTFCTGGIRCEKGALLLKAQGFKNVFQLEGGILEYFSKVPGGDYFNGECFVFDERETVDILLKPKRSS